MSSSEFVSALEGVSMLQKISRVISVVALLGVSVSGYAADEHATKALQCRQVLQCSYFADLYGADTVFQQKIKQAFADKNIPLPSWIAHSTSVPMVPVMINGQSFLLGLGGEPHNMSHQAAFLYGPNNDVIAIRYADPHGKVHFIGTDNPVYLNVLKQYVDPTTSLSQIVTSDYATLPVILNPYIR